MRVQQSILGVFSHAHHASPNRFAAKDVNKTHLSHSDPDPNTASESSNVITQPARPAKKAISMKIRTAVTRIFTM
jgi:hypothetical protein